VVRRSYFRTATILVTMAAAAVLAVIVAYGTASAQTDTTTPTVISTVPAVLATSVDRDANIKVKFTERMLVSSINSDTVRLYEGDLEPGHIDEYPCFEPCGQFSRPLSATVSYNVKKKRATLNPTDRLKTNTTYTAIVEGAGDDLSIKDKAGNEMATDYIWRFTTGAS
jgi:Bacterial Ig-like domain